MAETKRSRGRSCLHTDHRACTCVLWTLTLILMLTRTRICIGKDQGREVGGRRKQFARANGYGTMRRERATFSPFLILSLSLCPPPFSSALKKFLERMSRVHARLCLWTLNRPILPGPRVTGFFGFRVRQWRTSHVLPSSLNLSFDFSSLSRLSLRDWQRFMAVYGQFLSWRRLSPIRIDEQCHACASHIFQIEN